MSKSRILLADDHTFLLQACEKWLAPVLTSRRSYGWTCFGWKPHRHSAGCHCVGYRHALLNGLDAGRELKKLLPGVKLIILQCTRTPDLRERAISAGASAYLPRHRPLRMVKAIHEALRGRTYINACPRQDDEDSFIRNPEVKHVSKELTPRQREVLQLLAEGAP